MVVIVMDNAANTIRGEMTRWFLEVKPGVFVGNVNAKIQELLWSRICSSSKTSGAVMIYQVDNEQGFGMRLTGMPKRTIIDNDGINLVKIQLL